MIKISVIIPHYNIPELLVRCINSIPEREDIQVIVVDDCSPNADTYKQKYPELLRPNVELYSTPKGGSAGRARNIGLDHAKGEWLSFIDADDFFPENIGQLFDQLTSREEDLIFTDFLTVMSDDISVVSTRDNWYKSLIERYSKCHEESIMRFKFDSMWGKLIRKDLVDCHHCRFSETRWSNDCYFAVRVGIFAKQIYVSPEVGYILTERSGSLASDYCGTVEETVVRTDVALRIRQMLVENNIPLGTANPTMYLNQLIMDRFSRGDRLRIAMGLWRHPRFMIHLIASTLK